MKVVGQNCLMVAYMTLTANDLTMQPVIAQKYLVV